MPYLQVDLPGAYAADVKRAFAARLIRLYAATMETQERIPSVALRELGPDNLVRLRGDEVSSVIVVMCDVRRGRPIPQRELLAQRIAAECASTFGFDPDDVVVEFTQHTPDEMYRYGALAPEWDAAEAAALHGS